MWLRLMDIEKLLTVKRQYFLLNLSATLCWHSLEQSSCQVHYVVPNFIFIVELLKERFDIFLVHLLFLLFELVKFSLLFKIKRS